MSVTYQHPKWWHAPLRKLGLIDAWMKLQVALGLWKPADAPSRRLGRLLGVIRKQKGCDCIDCVRWCLATNCGGTCLCSEVNCGCACTG
jgi:hypothetical protein